MTQIIGYDQLHVCGVSIIFLNKDYTHTRGYDSNLYHKRQKTGMEKIEEDEFFFIKDAISHTLGFAMSFKSRS